MNGKLYHYLLNPLKSFRLGAFSPPTFSRKLASVGIILLAMILEYGAKYWR